MSKNMRHKDRGRQQGNTFEIHSLWNDNASNNYEKSKKVKII